MIGSAARSRVHSTLVGQPLRVVGRYSIHAEIGVGGMATVYLGRLVGAAGFSRVVAIKGLHPHLARSTKFVKAFLDEARLAARIRHPNVISTLDVLTDDSEVLIVMEYVAGATLDELGPPPMSIACGIAWAMLNGLHAAHTTTDEQGQALGIVHRDVSPQNVLVGADGQARVLDFGIAKADHRLQLTAPGEIKGKPAYMAPEQLVLECSSPRSDIYAAGVLLWELLSGRSLYEGSTESIIRAKMAGDVVPPLSTVADVPQSLDAILARALRRNPDERFASAHELAEALEAAVPLASPREIGDWVRREAAGLLADRAARIATMESAPSALSKEARRSARSTPGAPKSTTIRALVPPSSVPSEETETPAEALVSIIPASSAWRWGWLPLLAVVLLVATGIVWLRGLATTLGVAGPGAAVPSSGVDRAPAEAGDAPSPAQQGENAASRTATAAGYLPVPPSIRPPIASPSVKPLPRPLTVPHCARPFVIDDAGIKHLKPECL